MPDLTIDDVTHADGSAWIADQVFPARVIDYRHPERPLDEVKTCLLELEGGRYAMMVLGTLPDGPGILSLDEVVLRDTKSRTRVVQRISDNTEIHWASSQGCGCGSRLRGFTPFFGRLLGVPLPRI